MRRFTREFRESNNLFNLDSNQGIKGTSKGNEDRLHRIMRKYIPLSLSFSFFPSLVLSLIYKMTQVNIAPVHSAVCSIIYLVYFYRCLSLAL